MGHYVTTADSDYFEGWCECDQRPCLSCVAAQRGLEAADKLRGDLVTVYREHHEEWPRSVFIDAVIEAFRKNGLELKVAPTKNLVARRADGAYTAGPPPDGRSVTEHLDELVASPCAKYGCGPFADGHCVTCGSV